MDHERYIVEQIKEAREIRGIPIAELARRSMIDSTQLGKVLRYERSLKPGECMRICYALDLTGSSSLIPDEIFGRLCELNKKAKGGKKR
jgi:transcriptional regulator with XRE-family HTH domain